MAGNDKKLSDFENMSFTREHNVFVPVVNNNNGNLENRKIPLSQFASNQDVNDEIEAKLQIVYDDLPQNPDNNTFYFVIDNPEES